MDTNKLIELIEDYGRNCKTEPSYYLAGTVDNPVWECSKSRADELLEEIKEMISKSE